jgi:hypothetical protein
MNSGHAPQGGEALAQAPVVVTDILSAPREASGGQILSPAEGNRPVHFAKASGRFLGSVRAGQDRQDEDQQS